MNNVPISGCDSKSMMFEGPTVQYIHIIAGHESNVTQTKVHITWTQFSLIWYISYLFINGLLPIIWLAMVYSSVTTIIQTRYIVTRDSCNLIADPAHYTPCLQLVLSICGPTLPIFGEECMGPLAVEKHFC